MKYTQPKCSATTVCDRGADMFQHGKAWCARHIVAVCDDCGEFAPELFIATHDCPARKQETEHSAC